MLVPFWRRVVGSLREGGLRFVFAMLGLAVMNAVYSTHFIEGLRMFDPAESAFVSCLGVVVMPIVMMAMRRRDVRDGGLPREDDRLRRSPGAFAGGRRAQLTVGREI